MQIRIDQNVPNLFFNSIDKANEIADENQESDEDCWYIVEDLENGLFRIAVYDAETEEFISFL